MLNISWIEINMDSLGFATIQRLSNGEIMRVNVFINPKRMQVNDDIFAH